MKSQLKKLTAIFLSICVVLSLTSIISFAADTTATISFANTAQRTEYTTSKQVWEQNGITVTNDKASSSSSVGNYSNPARFYKGSKVTIEYPNMTKIEITSTSSDYATPWSSSFTDSNATATVSGTKVTITFKKPLHYQTTL
ncbi:MAG: hypothetical protein IIW33_03760 [Oscillospiraceae bacterium]|nr:hypothetical protein [Oscillospiraceae bacterium]